MSCILRHRGVQLILAYSLARPAVLVAGKGRGEMFLFLLFLHFHSCSSFFPDPLFHLFYYLGDDTKWPTRIDMSLNPNTINQSYVIPCGGARGLKIYNIRLSICKIVVERVCSSLWRIYIGLCPRAGLGGSAGCAVRLETRRSRVQPPPRSATFFRGDWSWNIFYGHSLPSADSRRAVVSFWRKNVHNTG